VQAEDAAWMNELSQRPELDKRLKTAAVANIKQLSRGLAKVGTCWG